MKTIQLQIPEASPIQKKCGWTIDCDFLRDVACYTLNEDYDALDLESVERVLLALREIEKENENK